MIGNIIPPAFPAGYIPPEIITGDTDKLVIGGEIESFMGQTSSYFGTSDDSYEFPSGTKITISQMKNIVTTKVIGRNGTVKEMTGMGDWDINIEFMIYASLYGSGILSPGDSVDIGITEIESILKKLKNLKKIWEKNGTLPVYQEKLNALGIEYIVLERMDLNDPESQWMQPVKIRAKSDTIHDIENHKDKTQ